MIGFTPCPRASLKSWTAPAMLPWSVKATAGISSSAARATRSGIRHAPSRIEYSEWTWRWTNGASDIPGQGQPSPRVGGPPPLPHRRGGASGCGLARPRVEPERRVLGRQEDRVGTGPPHPPVQPHDDVEDVAAVRVAEEEHQHPEDAAEEAARAPALEDAGDHVLRDAEEPPAEQR